MDIYFAWQTTWILFLRGKLGTKRMDFFWRGKLGAKHMDNFLAWQTWNQTHGLFFKWQTWNQAHVFSLIFSVGMSTHVTLKEVTDINIFQISCSLMPVDVETFSDPHLRSVE